MNASEYFYLPMLMEASPVLVFIGPFVVSIINTEDDAFPAVEDMVGKDVGTISFVEDSSMSIWDVCKPEVVLVGSSEVEIWVVAAKAHSRE